MLLTYLNYTYSLIYNFKDVLNILAFHSYISGVFFGDHFS